MTGFPIDEYVRTTLGAATNAADGTPLTAAQVESVIRYLKSPGSGPDGSSSYADYLARQLQAHPARLPAGTDYVGFSGKDGAGISNFNNAEAYVADMRGKAGIIGDTPWGRFVEQVPGDPEFAVVKGKFETFMRSNGFEPMRANYQGALQDVMWNAGSPEYFGNAIARGRPIVAFVENAPAGRGFSNFELTTALKHPDAVINGYPVSAFGSDPLAFASKSAAEFQQLERTIAQAASTNGGHAISVQQVRSNLNLIEGYDAVGKTVFGRPLEVFKALDFEEMTAARAAWQAARAGLMPGLRTLGEPANSPRTAGEPGTPRGPPGPTTDPPSLVNGKAAAAKGAAEVTPELAAESALLKGMSPSGKLMLKGAGAAGIALLAYDFASTGNRVVELRSQGNVTGAESSATHFVGRNVGGIGGGFATGFLYGALTGSETGPGAIVTGLVGGVAGAYFGEKWAEQRDNDKIYKQTDHNGNEWARDPADPQGQWLRTAATEQVRVTTAPAATPAVPGAEVNVAPKVDADGDPVFHETRYVASGNLARQLNYQSANASYELGFANPVEPRNPYRLESREPGVEAYQRDPLTATWSALHSEPLEHGMTHRWSQPVPAAQAQALEQQSQLIVASNAANTPAALAARYEVAYAQFGWEREGPVPEAVKHAAATVGSLQASDGDTYTRGADGEWTHDGWLYDTKATGSVRNELNATYASQLAGLADMKAMAGFAAAHPQAEPDSVRESVANLYRSAKVPRTEEEIDAAVAAVRRDHARDGLGQHSFSLELLRDPVTQRYGPNSPIATYSDDGKEQMVLKSVTTAEEMKQPAATPIADQGGKVTEAGRQVPTASGQTSAGQFINDYVHALKQGDTARLGTLTGTYAESSQFNARAATAGDPALGVPEPPRQLPTQEPPDHGAAR